jgi:signal transduction histidine kinase/ActR/RegA family two-component response regulator
MRIPFDYATILESIPEPLTVINRAGILLYANGEFLRASGWADRPIAGTRLVDAWPAMARILEHASYLHALATGQKMRFDYVYRPLPSRYEIVVQPLGNGNSSICFRAVEERSMISTARAEPVPASPLDPAHPQAALHAAMLADMGSLRAELGAAETFYQVASILGRLPDVSRSTFGTVDTASKTVTIHRDFCRDAPSMAGVYPMRETEMTSHELARGQVVVINDVTTDYRSRGNPELRFKRGYMACVAVPLMRDNQWAASLMVQSPVPRVWSPEEIDLIRTAAERTWLAVENVRLLQEARQANAAKDQFLAMLSHELRTPLTPVVMMLNSLQNSPAIPAQEKSDLDMIRRNIDLETRLIDDLLDITRISNGKLTLTPRPVRVHELLEHACQICQPDADAGGIDLRCEFNAMCDEVSADAARLEQVFWNLIKNAVKFTPAGGCVRVISDDQHQELHLQVQDTGAGICPEVLPRIFNAFEQGEKTITRTFGGLGLGLAISKAIVDLHGGRIWAQSDGAHRGCVFHVALPLKASPATSRIADPAGAPRSTGRQKDSLKILLVDDHADTMRVMRRILGNWGMNVTSAGGMHEALCRVAEAKFDLIISDIGLPDGSGCELIQQIQKHHRVPAIALSGFGMEADIRRSVDAGFSAHLTKPVSLEQLREVIASLTPDNATADRA